MKCYGCRNYRGNLPERLQIVLAELPVDQQLGVLVGLCEGCGE